ncbi:WD40/YVTN/BNR-like repeat-containing protein [Pseudoalteromonas sp. T1lg65]|uniref:WD40/YVTN/BNR-like repeat-containing protein n=1 Tax=Pseudoalteromonas sp. T1lg65 TaxID=2077101 RepID=UPI003F791A5C
MKKLAAASILSISICMPLHAQTTSNSALMVKEPQQTLFTDIVDKGDGLVAVGKHGTIIHKPYSESNWTQASVPVQSLLTAVTFKTESLGWACGHDATIIKTEDGGKNWTLQQYLPELERPCLDIEFVDSQKGYAIGAYGMFYETEDGGNTWQKRFINEFLHPDDVSYLEDLKNDDPKGYEIETAFILPHFNRLLITEQKIWLVGEMGLVAESTDGGKTWRKLEKFYAGSFFAIAQHNKGQTLIAGLRGNAFIEQLDAFIPLETKKSVTINSIVSNDDISYLLANSGVIFKVQNNKIGVQQLKNGHAIMAGVLKNNRLILATEKGIEEIEVTK